MATDPKPDDRTKPTEPLPPSVPLPPDIEVGGRQGLEPTRYGDWEKGGIAVDF